MSDEAIRDACNNEQLKKELDAADREHRERMEQLKKELDVADSRRRQQYDEALLRFAEKYIPGSHSNLCSSVVVAYRRKQREDERRPKTQ